MRPLSFIMLLVVIGAMLYGLAMLNRRLPIFLAVAALVVGFIFIAVKSGTPD